jgi:protein gp37
MVERIYLGPKASVEAMLRGALRDQCEAAKVAFLYKQRLDEKRHKVSLPMLDGRQWAEYPEVSNG